MSFQLTDLPSVAEITALYDFYSIDRVDVEWRLGLVPKDITTLLANYPIITFAPDYDDSTAPGSRNEVFEYGKNARVEQFSATRPVIRTTVVPRISNTVYKTGVTSAYSLAPVSTLVDATNADAPHYGLKWWTEYYNSTQNTGGSILVYLKYHVTCVATR